MRYHLIAIGGSIMHNLAIDLLEMGHSVTGSDDEIYEPSRSRLKQKGLLPSQMGWDTSRISDEIDVVILGKHARLDNPELKRALDLGLKVVSFPEFVNENTNATHRLVITGSHGKTTTTSMIMHVLNDLDYDFDYLVGAQIKGFDKMVKLSGADILVVEGDEYPSSCLDDRAKMLHYNATATVITGVAWDHVNIYKTYNDYLAIFHSYLNNLDTGTKVYFDQTDKTLLDMVVDRKYSCDRISYQALPTNKKGQVMLRESKYEIGVFGEHNMKNLSAAMLLCNELGVTKEAFLKSIASFTGAAKRLEIIKDTPELKVYKDFAHAPSKVLATCNAVRSKYQNAHIVGILELHTFSSLRMSFIEHYNGAAQALDKIIVFFDPEALKHKQLPMLEPEAVAKAFGHDQIQVSSNPNDLLQQLVSIKSSKTDVILIMSSGNMGGLNPYELLTS